MVINTEVPESPDPVKIFNTFFNWIYLSTIVVPDIPFIRRREMYFDGVLFDSKWVGLFISCEKPNNVVILYNSKPQRLLVPSSHQLVDFSFRSPITKLHKGDSKAMLEQICSNPERKISTSSARLIRRTIDTCYETRFILYFNFSYKTLIYIRHSSRLRCHSSNGRCSL